MLIKSLIESFTLLPMGKGLLDGDTMLIIIEIISNYFIIGLKIALPIVLIILLFVPISIRVLYDDTFSDIDVYLFSFINKK